MCEHYKYMLQLKSEYDIKYQKTGIRTQMIYLCEVEDVEKGLFKLHYDKNRFNLVVKECGKCHICRFKRASIKACQAQSEYKTSGKGAFITLTFGDKQIREYLKKDKRYQSMSDYKKNKYAHYLQWTLEKREFQLFMKRLRWHFYQEDLLKYSVSKGYVRNYLTNSGRPRKKVIKCDDYNYSDFEPRKIRFLHSGEYGSEKSRPHHHCVVFGVNFSFDYSEVRWSWKKKKNVIVHFNHLLNELWQFGDITTDNVTYQTCNYVARYVTKKVVNKNKDYEKHDISGSVYRGRLPEYCTQSNRKGLGYDYYIQNAHKINKDLSLTFKNNEGEVKSCPLPRYFKELMRRHYKSDWLRMQRESEEKQLQFSSYEPKFLMDRMRNDRRKVSEMLSQFCGDYEYCKVSLNKLKYLEYELKKKVFDHFNVFMKSYNDTDFIKREHWRLTCYKNYEKYKKHLYRTAINQYVVDKFEKPNQNLLMLDTYRKIKTIKALENPFKKDNMDYFVLKTGRDIREDWLHYEKNYA